MAHIKLNGQKIQYSLICLKEISNGDRYARHSNAIN